MLALLMQGLTSSESWDAALRRGEERRRMTVATIGTLEMRPGGVSGRTREFVPSSDVRVVPIRFPTKLHEQLRAWCEQNGFPMAAVVRGLVERFLESTETSP